MPTPTTKYRVHIYAIVQVQIEVEAATPQEAVDKADAAFSSNPDAAIARDGIYADDVESFLVDELNSDGELDENCKSIAFDKERRPQ